MRQFSRFRSSCEPGGDLITGTLTLCVAAAALVNGRVIGHCRPSKISQLGWDVCTSTIKHWAEQLESCLRNLPVCSAPWYSAWSPIPTLSRDGKSERGMGMIPDPRQIGDRTPVPVPGRIGDGDGKDPRQIWDGTPIPVTGRIGDGDGDADRGFKSLIFPSSGVRIPYQVYH